MYRANTDAILPESKRGLHRLLEVMISALCALAVPLCSVAGAVQPRNLLGEITAGSIQTVDHSAWDKLLKTYVKPGDDGVNRVDYAAFQRNGHEELKLYIQRLEAVDPQMLDRREQFAFLVNLYNAKTIEVVLNNYPVKSIRDISLGGGLAALVTGGLWKAKILNVKGADLSLDDIEHGLLRLLFKDPRVHYALNCASIDVRICRLRLLPAPNSTPSSMPPPGPTSITLEE
jgi:hypothetical protein